MSLLRIIFTMFVFLVFIFVGSMMWILIENQTDRLNVLCTEGGYKSYTYNDLDNCNVCYNEVPHETGVGKSRIYSGCME